ncbi:MAG TPA: hypothetical protein VGD61_21735 [Pyrinomonadaceae bacterium]
MDFRFHFSLAQHEAKAPNDRHQQRTRVNDLSENLDNKSVVGENSRLRWYCFSGNGSVVTEETNLTLATLMPNLGEKQPKLAH